MSISFKKENELLILIFDMDLDGFYQEKLNGNDTIKLKNCFRLNRSNWIREDNDNETLKFIIGTVEGEYVHLEKEVFETKHEFYFAKDIQFKLNLFFS